MRPILLQWQGVRVYSYPAMLYLGLICGIAAGNWAANLADLNSARVLGATLVLLILALSGARLLFVTLHWEVYRREPRRVWRRSEGGAAMYGGLIVALPASIALLPLLGIPFLAFWDVATFTMLVGMVFARIGCLLNGCCAGRRTTGRLGLYLPDHKGSWDQRIPTPLLEAGWGTLLLAVAVVIWNYLPIPGVVLAYGLGGYGIGRCVLEATREDQDRLLGRISAHMVISAALILLSLLTLLIAWPE